MTLISNDPALALRASAQQRYQAHREAGRSPRAAATRALNEASEAIEQARVQERR